MRRLGPGATLAVCCLSYLALGASKATLGPALPELAEESGRAATDLGSLYTIVFASCLVAQLAAGAVIDRVGARRVVSLGLASLALWALVGTAGTPSLSLLRVLAGALGLAVGAIGMGCNLQIAGVFAGRRSAAALNALNVFFGVGAVVGPLLAGLAQRHAGSALDVHFACAGSALLLLPLLIASAEAPRLETATSPSASARSLAREPVLWLLAFSMLLYTGVEVGLTAWTSEYLVRTAGLSSDRAAYAVSAFWLALTAGRLLVALGLRDVSPQTLLAFGSAGAVIGAIALCAAYGSATPTLVALVVLGLALAPLHPTMVALVASSFPRAPGSATSFVVSISGIGGMIIPWAQGRLLAESGLASVVLVAACLFGLFVLNTVRARKRSAHQPLESV